MADSKKYYYLKLKDNFFDSDEIKILDFDKKTIDMYAPKAIKEIQNIKNTIYENRERLEGYNEYH